MVAKSLFKLKYYQVGEEDHTQFRVSETVVKRALWQPHSNSNTRVVWSVSREPVQLCTGRKLLTKRPCALLPRPLARSPLRGALLTKHAITVQVRSISTIDMWPFLSLCFYLAIFVKEWDFSVAVKLYCLSFYFFQFRKNVFGFLELLTWVTQLCNKKNFSERLSCR